MTDGYQTLRKSGLPVYLYGTGNGAEKIASRLHEKGIPVSGVFASEGFVRERHFLGFPVESLADVEARHGRIAAVLCFGLEDAEAERLLRPIAARHLLLAPPVPVYGEGGLDLAYLQEHEDLVRRVYGWLSDASSREQFASVIRYHISADPLELLNGKADFTPPSEYYAHSLVHIDVGAYDGDTAREYLQGNPHCERILAFEPDAVSYRKLCAGTDPSRVTCYPFACGASDGSVFLTGSGRGAHCGAEGREVPLRSLDSVCGYPFIGSDGIRVGSIKIDAEGQDAQVLCGAGNLITACKPVICVSSYHKAYDLLTLPLQLKQLRYRSKLYFRRKNCVPDWDHVFYLV